MLTHISYLSVSDPSSACVDTVLPGVNDRLDDYNRNMDKLNDNMEELRSEFKEYREESIDVMKETVHVEVGDNIRREAVVHMDVICKHIGRFPGLNNEG